MIGGQGRDGGVPEIEVVAVGLEAARLDRGGHGDRAQPAEERLVGLRAVDVDDEQAERRAEDQGDAGVGELLEPDRDPRGDRRHVLERLPPDARLLRAGPLGHDGEPAAGEVERGLRHGRLARRRPSGTLTPRVAHRMVIRQCLLLSRAPASFDLAGAHHSSGSTGTG